MNKRKMLGPDTITTITMPFPLPHSASPSTPAPRSQVHPTSPDITTRYSPHIVKRMQGDECFNCRQIGHWSCDCPLRRNSPNSSNKRLSSSPKSESPLNPRNIYCRCGHGFCTVKTSRSVKNPERQYYSCPIKRGVPCTTLVKFCDEHIDESFLQPPPYKYPECECGAGVCRKEKDPDVVGKDCFTCPIEKGHGKCDYKVTEDQLLHSNKSIVPIQQSSQEQYDLGERGGLHVEQSKRMRMMDSIETPLSLTLSDIPEGDSITTPEVTPSRRVSFAEFQVDDDLQEVVNSVPWDAVEREAVILSSNQSARRASCRQNLFGNSSFPDAFADASFGRCPRSWLGRLVFLCPAQSLKLPAPQPIYCCIFPSFDLIVVPTQAITGDDHFECNKQLAITNISENAAPPSNGCHSEVSVSRDVTVNPSQSSQGSQRKPMSKAERERQMALVLQQGLLSDLENMDPHDIESMRKAAEESFLLLNGLSVDFKLFSEHVRDFINHAASVAKIDKSMENSLTFEECNQRLDAERASFSRLQEDFTKTEELLGASNQHRQHLREEVSNLEAMLHERRKQLNSCEVKSLKIETQLLDLKKRMVEANIVLNDRSEEVEIARRLNEERETKQMAAKAALEKAKLELTIN